MQSVLEFIETPLLTTPRDFPTLLEREAARRNFEFTGEFIRPGTAEWDGTLTSPNCTLKFRIRQEAHSVMKLYVQSSTHVAERFRLPELEFFYQRGGYWMCELQELRNDWLAWFFSEFAVEGEIVMANMRKLAEKYSKR